MDGSLHDRFGGRGPWCCLMVMVDDATGTVFARFYERETQATSFDVFGRYAEAHGLPAAVYVDGRGRAGRTSVGTGRRCSSGVRWRRWASS